MSQPLFVKFGVLPIPAGVTTSGRLKLSLCLTPRLSDSGAPQALVESHRVADSFAAALEHFFEKELGVGRQSRKLKNEVLALKVNVTMPEVLLDRDWFQIWHQGGGKDLRREAWRVLLATAAIAPWSEGPSEEAKPQIVKPENAEQAAEVVRNGRATLESPGLARLGNEVRTAYQRIADHLAQAELNPLDDQAALKAADNEFIGIAREFETQLDRLSSHGSITPPASGGQADNVPNNDSPGSSAEQRDSLWMSKSKPKASRITARISLSRWETRRVNGSIAQDWSAPKAWSSMAKPSSSPSAAGPWNSTSRPLPG
jgi:hypothetical protein